MNQNAKFALVFLGSGAVMFLIFFFYPAQIFDAELFDDYSKINEELSMKEFLGLSEPFNAMLEEAGWEVRRKLSGWMILFICLIGLPLMIALRTVVTKGSKETEEQNENE